MNAAIETVRSIFRRKDAERVETIESLAGRLLDGENIEPAKLEKLIDSLGTTAAEFEETVARIDANRKREAERARLQALADQYDALRLELSAAAAEREEHRRQTEAHAKEMKLQAAEIERRETRLRQRIEESKAAEAALRRGTY